MPPKTYNVLFLCTGNSARSVMAEVLINRWGNGQFVGYSAGSFPKGKVHPMTLQLLRKLELPIGGLRSKSWDEFSKPGAPTLDFVFTVCDNAAGEVCPVWPGQPISAHWGVDDPAAVEGTEAERFAAFHKAFRELETRVKIFCSISVSSLDRMRLKEKVDEIGRLQGASASQP